MLFALGFCAVFIGFLFYMNFRSDRVYKYLMDLIDQIHEYNKKALDEKTYDTKLHGKLYDWIPEYGEMLLKFWVWPLSRFGNLKDVIGKAHDKKCKVTDFKKRT